MYEFLNELELEKNDTLLVASNIIPLALSIKNFDPNDLINELQKRVKSNVIWKSCNLKKYKVL